MTWWAALALLHALVFVPHPASHRAPALADMTPDTEVLVLGSSHVAAGVIPGNMRRPTAVAAFGAMNYECMELVADQALRRAPHVGVVAIECDVLPLRMDSILHYNGDYSMLYALGVRLRDLPRNPYWKLKQALRESRALYPLFFMPRPTPRGIFWNDRWRDALRRDRESREFAGSRSEEPRLNPNNDGRVVVAYHRADMLPDHSSANQAALRRLIRRLRQEWRRVALVRLPHHATYLHAQPEEWERQVRALAAELQAEFPGTAYLDLFADAGFADEDFMDGHHLNRQGAARFTERLNAWLLETFGTGNR